MRCNIPKVKHRDMRRMTELLTRVKCCKCGQVIEVMSEAYAILNFDKKRYENRVCEKCQRESEDTQ